MFRGLERRYPDVCYGIQCGPLFGQAEDHNLPVAFDHDGVVVDLESVNLHPSVDDKPLGTGSGVDYCDDAVVQSGIYYRALVWIKLEDEGVLGGGGSIVFSRDRGIEYRIQRA